MPDLRRSEQSEVGTSYAASVESIRDARDRISPYAHQTQVSTSLLTCKEPCARGCKNSDTHRQSCLANFGLPLLPAGADMQRNRLPGRKAALFQVRNVPKRVSFLFPSGWQLHEGSVSERCTVIMHLQWQEMLPKAFDLQRSFQIQRCKQCGLLSQRGPGI